MLICLNLLLTECHTSVWSLDDTTNERSELPSVSCQLHHSWQLYSSAQSVMSVLVNSTGN